MREIESCLESEFNFWISLLLWIELEAKCQMFQSYNELIEYINVKLLYLEAMERGVQYCIKYGTWRHPLRARNGMQILQQADGPNHTKAKSIDATFTTIAKRDVYKWQ